MQEKLLTEQRRQLIEGLVGERGAVSSDELSRRFGVTHMTVYRDLKALEALGVLRAVRGGAVRADSGTAAEPVYASKKTVNQEQKECIARYTARRFIDPGDIITLEAGTTVAAMVKHLGSRNLTLLTNGLETVNEAATLPPGLTILCCGGVLREVSHTFVGPQAEAFFRTVRTKTFFLGATGLALPEGISDPNPLEVQVKKAMTEGAERVVLLLDGSKMGRRSLFPTVPLNRLHALVTDASAPPDYLKALKKAGVAVEIAE
jgi:DeoR/GlpR family transcriptional regulator of sugar metabolism